MPEGKRNMFQCDADAPRDDSDDERDEVRMRFVPGVTEEEQRAIRAKLRPVVRVLREQGFGRADK